MKKGTFLIALLAAALGAAVWYFEFKREKPKEEPADAPKKAFAFQDADVTALRITRPSPAGGAAAIVFERQKDGWRITEPRSAAPDAGAIDNILLQLDGARITKRFAPAPDKLTAFGFDKPGVELEVKLKSGVAHRVRFADRDFTGGSVYSRLDGAGDVLVLPSEFLEAVNKPLLEFRDRRIATFREDEVTRMRVRNERVTLVAERNDKGAWILAEPAGKKGTEIFSSRILLPLENVRATEILDEPSPAIRGKLARPRMEIELSGKDAVLARFFLAPEGKDAALVASSASNACWKVPRSTYDSLNFKLDDIVKKPE